VCCQTVAAAAAAAAADGNHAKPGSTTPMDGASRRVGYLTEISWRLGAEVAGRDCGT